MPIDDKIDAIISFLDGLDLDGFLAKVLGIGDNAGFLVMFYSKIIIVIINSVRELAETIFDAVKKAIENIKAAREEGAVEGVLDNVVKSEVENAKVAVQVAASNSPLDWPLTFVEMGVGAFWWMLERLATGKDPREDAVELKTSAEYREHMKIWGA